MHVYMVYWSVHELKNSGQHSTDEEYNEMQK